MIKKVLPTKKQKKIICFWWGNQDLNNQKWWFVHALKFLTRKNKGRLLNVCWNSRFPVADQSSQSFVVYRPVPPTPPSRLSLTSQGWKCHQSMRAATNLWGSQRKIRKTVMGTLKYFAAEQHFNSVAKLFCYKVVWCNFYYLNFLIIQRNTVSIEKVHIKLFGIKRIISRSCSSLGNKTC